MASIAWENLLEDASDEDSLLSYSGAFEELRARKKNSGRKGLEMLKQQLLQRQQEQQQTALLELPPQRAKTDSAIDKSKSPGGGNDLDSSRSGKVDGPDGSTRTGHIYPPPAGMYPFVAAPAEDVIPQDMGPHKQTARTARHGSAGPSGCSETKRDTLLRSPAHEGSEKSKGGILAKGKTPSHQKQRRSMGHPVRLEPCMVVVEEEVEVEEVVCQSMLLGKQQQLVAIADQEVPAQAARRRSPETLRALGMDIRELAKLSSTSAGPILQFGSSFQASRGQSLSPGVPSSSISSKASMGRLHPQTRSHGQCHAQTHGANSELNCTVAARDARLALLKARIAAAHPGLAHGLGNLSPTATTSSMSQSLTIQSKSVPVKQRNFIVPRFKYF